GTPLSTRSSKLSTRWPATLSSASIQVAESLLTTFICAYTTAASTGASIAPGRASKARGCQGQSARAVTMLPRNAERGAQEKEDGRHAGARARRSTTLNRVKCAHPEAAT